MLKLLLLYNYCYQELADTLPADPLEAELLAMAELVESTKDDQGAESSKSCMPVVSGIRLRSNSQKFEINSRSVAYTILQNSGDGAPDVYGHLHANQF